VAHHATEERGYGETLGSEHRAIYYRGNGASHRLRDDPKMAGTRHRGTVDGGRFKKQLVDAADTNPLEATPPYRLVSRTKDGTVQYTYADPDNCRCVYLGGPKEYAEYRRLRQLDDERRLAAEGMWGWNSWGLELP